MLNVKRLQTKFNPAAKTIHQRAKCAFWRFRLIVSLLRDFVDVFYNVSRKQIRKK